MNTVSFIVCWAEDVNAEECKVRRCGWMSSGSAVQCGSCQSSRFVSQALEATDALSTVYLHNEEVNEES